MLWWQSILCYWFSELLEVTGKSFVNFLHWPRRIVLMAFMLSWLIFACFPSVFWECIQIHVFLCRKARHFTTPWSKCDILIWAQAVSSDKAFSPWWWGGMAGGEQGACAPKPGLFLLLKFGEHGDHFWLRCVTHRSNRWLRTSRKRPRHQEPQLPPHSWAVSVFLRCYGVSRDAAGKALCRMRMHPPRRDSFNQDIPSG